ncbi:ABC transporter permease [Bacillus sp. FJAT-27445]|uniref:ABC transporter permease n=1 Tax=Bacillus sp. FJAT-27445 TaxID=1679166 RepID=UPI0007436274|nr:ABC transporter permease subunit [Bacillus sp. FJAT-27445]
MSQFHTLLQKEILEMWRNFKWIWVPIVFIILGVQEPLTTYYLPQIIDSVGGLPEGAVIEIPTPSPAEVLVGGLGQYNTMGFIIIILLCSSLVAGEVKSGTAAMILVKPVKHGYYIAAKWAGALLLVWSSFFIGFLVTWYYTGLLFDWVPFDAFLGSFFIEGLWLSFIVTITVFFSSIYIVPGAAGFSAAAVAIILTLASGSLSHLLEWSPGLLPSYASSYLVEESLKRDGVIAIAITAVLFFILIFVAIRIFKKKELAI